MKFKPILIFPDNLLPSQAYQREIEKYSNHFQVLSFDYPGTGKSTREMLYPDEREVDPWGFWADPGSFQTVLDLFLSKLE
jgi:hypothetical protein